MAAFASDTFEAHTYLTDLVGSAPTVGGNWTDGSDSGSPSPLNVNYGPPLGVVIAQTDSATSFTYVATTPASADYYVQATVTPQSGGSNGVAGVCGRKNAATGSVTSYVADYYDHTTAGSRQWRLYGFNAGALIGGSTLGTYTENIGATTKTLKLEMIGPAIKLYVDGVVRVSVTDSTITSAGRAGVVLGNATAPGSNAVFLDAFTAELITVSPAYLRRRPSGLYTR